MLYTIGVSLWRSFIPYVTAFIVLQAARMGYDLDNATVNGVLIVMGGFGYQAALRSLEEYISPRWGWLLGLASKPSYQGSGKHRGAEEGDASL